LKQLLLDLTQAPPPTFANFVAARSAESLDAFRAAAAGSADRVLYVWGEPGAGKTHLLKALAAARPGTLYLRGVDYTGTENAPVLALDGVEALDDERQVALFNAFNERTHQLIAVSATPAPRDDSLVALRRVLATRLATGLTYRLAALTDHEKRAALHAHAKARGFALSEEVAAYLLTHARRDMASLIRALDALDRHSVETGRPITVPLLKAALQPDLAAAPESSR